MSAEVVVRAGLIAALRGDAELMAELNGIFDGAPVRATVPYAVVGECLASHWGAKDLDGRELRLTIGLQDAGETPERLAGVLARVEAVVQAIDGDAGWRVVGARMLRSRLFKAREKDGWQAVADYRLRVVRD
jgi:hypothetical protein